MTDSLKHSSTAAHACPAGVTDPLIGSYAGVDKGRTWDIYHAKGEEGEADMIFVRWGEHANHDVTFFAAGELLVNLEECTPHVAAIYRDVARRIKEAE